MRYSPEIRTLLARSGLVMFFASGLMALLPSIARRISSSSVDYGILLGAFGSGAVLGALLLQKLRSRFSGRLVISCGVALFGVATIAAGVLQAIWPLVPVMLVAGAAWVSFLSLFNVQVLNRAPDWVRARVLAVSLLVFQGAVAAGSAAWGAIAVRAGISQALLWAGVGAILTAVSALFLRVSDDGPDLTPWDHWRLPPVKAEPDRRVLVTVEYDVSPGNESEFLEAMREYGRVRLRDGASRWGICRDTEASSRYLETFIVPSWAEHLRQHDRLRGPTVRWSAVHGTTRARSRLCGIFYISRSSVVQICHGRVPEVTTGDRFDLTRTGNRLEMPPGGLKSKYLKKSRGETKKTISW